jgi:thiazole synthase ThiGH ThiG subunit
MDHGSCRLPLVARGSGLGTELRQSPYQQRKELVIDAGVGTAFDAVLAIELGVDADDVKKWRWP